MRQESATDPDVSEPDPDTGETTTTRLRDDAESDPMNPQTEPVDVGDESPQQAPEASKNEPSGQKQSSGTGQIDSGSGTDDKSGKTSFESSAGPTTTADNTTSTEPSETPVSETTGSDTQSEESPVDSPSDAPDPQVDEFTGEDGETDPSSQQVTPPSGAPDPQTEEFAQTGASVSGPADAPDPQVEEFANDQTAEMVEDSAQGAEQDAADQLDSQTDADIDTDDVEARTTRGDDGQLQIETSLSEEGEKTLQNEAADDAFQDVQQQTDADLERDDVEIDTSGESVTASLTDSGLREEAAAQSEEFDESDFLVTRDGEVFLSNEAQRAQIASGIEGVSADEVVLQDTRSDGPETYGEVSRALDGGGSTTGVQTDVGLTDQGQIDATAAQTGGVDAEDLDVQDGEVVVVEGGTPSQLDQSVDRFESLTGADVPGEGRAIPEVDPQETVENATGLDLPELRDDQPIERGIESTAGDIVESGGSLLNQAGNVDAPFTDTDINDLPGAAADTVPDSPDGTNSYLFRAQVEAEQRVNGLSEAEAEERVTQQAQDIDESTNDSFSPAVGRSPTSGLNAARGVAGIAGITGGAVAVNELGIPEQEQQQSGGVTVPDQQPQSGEISVPDQTVEQTEIPTESPVGESEVDIPMQEQSRDPTVVQTQQVQIGRETPQQSRDEVEIVDPGELDEPDQPAPSPRERQRRDDLDPYERTFPTGGSSVADGSGTAEAQGRTEQIQQSEVTQPAETIEPSAGSSPIDVPAVASGDDQTQIPDTQPIQGSQPDQGIGQEPSPISTTSPMAGVDSAIQPIQSPMTSPATAITDGFADPIQNADALQDGVRTSNQVSESPINVDSSASGPQRPNRRPDLNLDFGGGTNDSRDSDDELLSETINRDLVNPFTGR